MKHLHTKIKHHVREKKNRYIASLVSLVLFFAVVGSAFFFTKSSDPHISELAFTEHSMLGKSAGSVVPASCGSFDHGLRTTCWNGAVINPECDSCSPQLPPDCAGVPGGGATVDYCGVCNGGVTGPNFCDGADASGYFTDQCCTTACGADRCGAVVRTCANGGLSGPVNCPVNDCAGVPNGSSVVDSCGVCGGSNSCLDCNGTPWGGASYDQCGVCGGNGTSCVVNGVCGTPQYVCAAGSSANNSSSAGYYTWTCNGQNGGSNSPACSYVQPCSVSAGNNSINPPTCTPVPVTTISADSVYISYNTATNVNWGAGTNSPTGCTAGGSWGGSKSISGGSQTTGNITATQTYTLYCSNAGGNGPIVSVTVNVCPVATPYRVGGACVNISGTISASPNPCLMSTGQTSCDTGVTWNTLNPIGTSNVTKSGNVVVFTGNSGTNQSTNIPAASLSETFFLNNNAITLASVTVPVRCANGLWWNGAAGCAPCQNGGCTGTGCTPADPICSTLSCINGETNPPFCKSKPTVSITLDNSTDLYISNYPNNNVAIRWDGTAGTDPDSCTIPSGNWSNAAATALPFKYTGPSALTDQLRTGGQFTYSYSCTNVGGSTLANAKVTVCDSMTPVLHPGNICLPAPVAGLSFVSGNYTSNAVVRLSCTNSSFYKLKKNGVTVDSGVIPEAATSYAKNVNISSEGDYTLECDYTSTDGHLFDSFSANTLKYRTKPPEPVVTLMANPVSISRGSASVISWIVMFPNSVQSPVRTPACVLTAAPVCTGTCTAAQNAASTTVNAILRNEDTDSSDPKGKRKINPTAVNTLPAGHDPEDWRATGRKTINLEKSMDFKLKCGGIGTQSSSTVRVIVTSSNEG